MKALRKQKIETANIQVGDQMVIPLAELGEFTATAHKVTDEGVMFIFDEYVTCRPMNNCSTKKGGFEKSDLKKWMDTVLFMAFPEELRDKIYGLTIPTVGQIVGHEDEWDNKNLEPDSDEQLPLMKECKNRIACFEDQLTWGWLRNATKEEFSSAGFAAVALRALLGFVRNSGWLSRNPGALCPVDLAVILGALMLVQKTFCIIVRMM
jgi:hypothetical protein